MDITIYASFLPHNDPDAFLTAASRRGVRPESQETYDNSVRKVVFRDPDGNEIGVAGRVDQGKDGNRAGGPAPHMEAR